MNNQKPTFANLCILALKILKQQLSHYNLYKYSSFHSFKYRTPDIIVSVRAHVCVYDKSTMPGAGTCWVRSPPDVDMSLHLQLDFGKYPPVTSINKSIN